MSVLPSAARWSNAWAALRGGAAPMLLGNHNRSNAGIRILFWGNQGNVNYRLASYLRRCNVECELVNLHKKMNARSNPSFVDPNFSLETSPWFRVCQGPFDAAFFQEIERNFDLVFASGHRGISAAESFAYTSVPVIVHTTGPMNIPATDQSDDDSHSKLSTLEKASLILTAHPETYARLEALGFEDKVRFQLPLLDMDDIASKANGALHVELRKKYRGYDRVFAWFSRNLTEPEDPTYKGTELFIEAAARYLIEHPRDKVRIVFGNHGPNAKQALDMLRSHGVLDHTDLVGHLDFPDLAAYLKLPNLVLFDNLAQGTISSGIFRDAMCLGTVLVRHIVVQDATLAYGKAPPVFDASDMASCLAAMEKAAEMSTRAMKMHQKKTREWARETLHWEGRINNYIELLREPVLRQRLTSANFN